MKLPDKQSDLQHTQNAGKSVIPQYKNSLAQNQLHTLLRFLPDPVLAFSLDNKVEYWARTCLHAQSRYFRDLEMEIDFFKGASSSCKEDPQ